MRFFELFFSFSGQRRGKSKRGAVNESRPVADPVTGLGGSRGPVLSKINDSATGLEGFSGAGRHRRRLPLTDQTAARWAPLVFSMWIS